MTDSSPSNHLDQYCGTVLTHTISQELREHLTDQIDRCSSFDGLGLSVMPYIAAWRTDKPGIWYEFASRRFLQLFQCDHATIAEEFCHSIIDHRQYKQTDIYPDIEESVLKREDLQSQRTRLRQQTVKEGVAEAVYKVVLPTGKQHWLKDWASITLFEQDNIYLSPGYLCDVTKEMSKKDYLDEINTTVTRDKALLVEAERSAALGQISAKMYHEIRNPVLAIGGMARRLVKKQQPANGHPLLDVIVKESKRLENILHTLFTYTETTAITPESANLVLLTKEVIDLLQSDFDRQHITVTLQVESPVIPLMLDKEQMHLALVHILKNSLEAMPDGGNLALSLSQDAKRATLSIGDSGQGIAEGHSHRVTEPFFTTKVYGTGLGLSLAQKAIDLHGGSMIFQQPDDGGTTVLVQLPLP